MHATHPDVPLLLHAPLCRFNQTRSDPQPYLREFEALFKQLITNILKEVIACSAAPSPPCLRVCACMCMLCHLCSLLLLLLLLHQTQAPVKALEACDCPCQLALHSVHVAARASWLCSSAVQAYGVSLHPPTLHTYM